MVYAVDIRDKFQPAQKIPNISALVNVILPFLTLGGALIFLAISLYAAFTIITNGNNPEKIAAAQKTLGYAIVGLFIVVTSFLVVKLIGFVLGITNILPI